MEKAIGCDVENESAFPLSPHSAGNRATVLIPVWCGAFDRECPEAMFAFYDSRGGLEPREIE
jgi:hypothetical protein